MVEKKEMQRENIMHSIFSFPCNVFNPFKDKKHRLTKI